MKCQSCESELAENTNYCPNCGASVGKTFKEEFKVPTENLIGEVKRLLREGNIIKLIVKDEKGNTLLEIPAWAGVVGTVLAPWLAALGAIAAVATNCRMSVIRRE